MKKKILGISIVIVLVVVAIVFFLVYTSTSKVIATRSRAVISYINGKEMKYEDIREFSFKKDSINKIKVTYNYEDVNDADKVYNEYKGIMTSLIKNFNLNMEIEQNKEKVIMKFDSESFKEFFGEDYSNMNEEQIKQKLKQDGFEVK